MIILKEVPTDIFYICLLYNFFYRDLSHNKLKAITKDSFKQLLSTKLLLLKNNNIENIEEGSFHDLINLTELYVLVVRNTVKYLSKISPWDNMVLNFNSVTSVSALENSKYIYIYKVIAYHMQGLEFQIS